LDSLIESFKSAMKLSTMVTVNRCQGKVSHDEWQKDESLLYRRYEEQEVRSMRSSANPSLT
jgi:hypothetical protein